MPIKNQAVDNKKTAVTSHSSRPKTPDAQASLEAIIQRTVAAPGSLTPQEAQQLQRAIGNRAMGQFLSTTTQRPTKTDQPGNGIQQHQEEAIQRKFMVFGKEITDINDFWDDETDGTRSYIGYMLSGKALAQLKKKIEAIIRSSDEYQIFYAGEKVGFVVKTPGGEAQFMHRGDATEYLVKQINRAEIPKEDLSHIAEWEKYINYALSELWQFDKAAATRIDKAYRKVQGYYGPEDPMYGLYMQRLWEECHELLGTRVTSSSSKDEEESTTSSLDFEGMRQFLQEMDDTFGASGLSQMGDKRHKWVFDRHDGLLHGGQHHGVRNVKLRQLYNDIRDKLVEHGELK